MLPDLESKTREDIVRENLRAAQAVHTAYMLDELRVYQVVERAVDLFKQGVLPIARGPVVQALAAYAFDSTRLTEAQRRNVYARAFGTPGGDAGAAGPNRDFEALWLRFAAHVAEYARVARPETLLWPRSAANVWVRRAARALAVNLSQHCTGETRAAAQALRDATDAQTALLRDAQLLQAFGARDMWQVIDGVNRRYLGGAPNTVHWRTLARAGATLIAWLATWADGQGGTLSDAAGVDEPANDDLIAAVNQWFAATGVSPADVLRNAGADRTPAAAAGTEEDGTPPTQDKGSHWFDAPVQRALDELTTAARTGGRGLCALFVGPAGSGKTVAAHLLGSALARDVFHVHLSQVVSRYVGETERNLERAFDQAEASGAVLLFDEADAVFGKRADTGDAHDRYTDTDSAYLLQRLENFAGVAVLESNLDVPVDDALLRRLRTVIRFTARS